MAAVMLSRLRIHHCTRGCSLQRSPQNAAAYLDQEERRSRAWVVFSPKVWSSLLAMKAQMIQFTWRRPRPRDRIWRWVGRFRLELLYCSAFCDLFLLCTNRRRREKLLEEVSITKASVDRIVCRSSFGSVQQTRMPGAEMLKRLCRPEEPLHQCTSSSSSSSSSSSIPLSAWPLSVKAIRAGSF